MIFWQEFPLCSLCAREAKTSVDTLLWLQSWFSEHCVGDWQHFYGIKIETLDNPGWHVSIDLRETPLEGRPFQEVGRDLPGGAGWLRCAVADQTFAAYCSPNHLSTVLEIFRDWAEA